MRARVAVIAWLIALLALPVSSDEAHYLFPAKLAARVQTGVRSGLVVGVEPEIAGVRVTVSSEIRALARAVKGAEGAVEHGDPRSVVVPASFALPSELASLRSAGLDDWQVLVRVVEYVSARIVLDEEDDGAQDAASALSRRRARCSGRANAAVGLLRTLGLPARVVHGIVVGDRAVRWHRWGEAWLDSLGWVPFDPGVAVGALGVRYVPLLGAGEGTPLAGIQVLGLDERGFAGIPVRNGLRVLPLRGATLRCLGGADGTPFWAALYAPDGSRRVRQGTGAVVFANLLPGRYRLVWGRGPNTGELSLSLSSEEEVQLRIGEVGS